MYHSVLFGHRFFIGSWIIWWAIACLSTGCSVHKPRSVTENDLEAVKPKEAIQREKSQRPLEPPAFSEKMEPSAKGLQEDIKLYSMVFENAQLSSVISAIVGDTDLNLSVEAEVDLTRPVTVNLKQVTFKEALDMVVVQGAGYAWKIQGGNLYIKRFEERVYHFDYLDLVGETNIDIGGDMLASGVENSGVKGKYQVTGSREKKNTDVWENIRETLEAMKSPEGLLRMDRSAGIISLADTPRNIDSMCRYLDSLSEALNRQVFIEAKIMEVSLSDENALGIDWARLNIEFTSDSGKLPDIFDFTVNSNGSVTLSNQSSVEGLLDFLQTQGDISVLSNPHLSLMNGQSAVMTVGYQFPYGDINGVDRDKEGIVTYATSIKRAVLGLQLGITARISEDRTVSLHIVPTITRIQGSEKVEIPTSEKTNSSISNPIIDLQELSTMVRVRDGQSVVLGGLISQTKQLNHEGLPWISKIPFIGGFFKHTDDKLENKELVILITPYIKEIS